MRILKTSLAALLLFSVIFMIGCSSNSTAPLADFEPEIVNNVDAFEFQATDVVDVTADLSYSWSNTGTQGSVNHSSVVTSGTADIKIFDADGTEVYSNGLVASANEPTIAGTAGTWTIQVSLVNSSGTYNFRVEKL